MGPLLAYAKQPPNAGDRGIAIGFRVLGQQLAGVQAAIRIAADDIGKRAAAIDPEIPALCHGRP